MDINQLLQTPPNPQPLQLQPGPIKNNKVNFVPLLSISGITFLSLGGLILLKSKNTAQLRPSPNPSLPPQTDITPTQVPKSIQHYLLASQTFFSQALNLQTNNSDENQKIELVNKSIAAATDAIKNFPNDYRGFYQRAHIYQSLNDSQPQFISQIENDLVAAFNLNSNSAEITRELANLYAKKGEAKNTIAYLIKTVSIEPTKAQNFYDLAKIQQQAGYFADALTTYNQLISLVTDPSQKTLIENEKIALEQIVTANPDLRSKTYDPKPNLPSTIHDQNAPTIQASLADKGLIIASPEEEKKIEVANQTDSNSLSGKSTLFANQTSLTIDNNNLTNASQIYVTALSGGKNKTLKVLSKTANSFTVGYDSPLAEDVVFNWFIIN